MKLIIIPIDGAVYVDEQPFSGLDLSFCPSNVHALQWKESKGWVEFKDIDAGTKPQNQVLVELPSWALEAKVVWDSAKAEEEAAKAAKAAEEEAAKAAEEEAIEEATALATQQNLAEQATSDTETTPQTN